MQLWTEIERADILSGDVCYKKPKANWVICFWIFFAKNPEKSAFVIKM